MSTATIEHSTSNLAEKVRELLSELGRTPETANHAEWMLYRHCRAGRGDDVALCFAEATYSYGELAAAASSCGAWLREIGVGAGDCVILMLPDCPVLAATYFGVVSTGATAIILNPALPPEEVFYIAQLARAVVAICDRAAFAGAAPLRHLAGMVKVVGADRCWRRSSEVVDSVEICADLDWLVTGGADNDAYGLLTSGSTGRPKLIVHRHIDILYGLVAFAGPVLQLGSEDCLICVAKASTGYGLGSSLLMPGLVGARAALVDGPPGQAILDAATAHRCTVLLGQPRFLADALQLAGDGDALASLRLVITGGEPLGAGLGSRWRAFCRAPLLDAYGNTEVGFLYISNRAGDTRIGSIGKPVDGLEVEIVDPSDNAVATGERGRLKVRGPPVIAAYRGAPEASRRHFSDGWFVTSDIASRDADGYFYVHGRADHFIKLGCGDWVNPGELERVLLQDARVAECAIIGAADQAGLTILRAVVVASGEGVTFASLAAELAQAIRACWPNEPFKQLGTIEFVEALPKTAAGKLDRAKLSPQSMTEFSYRC